MGRILMGFIFSEIDFIKEIFILYIYITKAFNLILEDRGSININYWT